jgi:hypothetical protein
MRITLEFFSLPLQVKPQERKELCCYVERKNLRCGARKATLLYLTTVGTYHTTIS